MQDLLVDRCTIRRATTTQSDTGEVSETFESLLTDVACAIQPRSGFYRLAEAGERGGATYVGYFPFDTDIRVDDEVVHTAGIHENTFRVTFVAPMQGHHLEVDLTTDI